jgi:hypothetical protein
MWFYAVEGPEYINLMHGAVMVKKYVILKSN